MHLTNRATAVSELTIADDYLRLFDCTTFLCHATTHSKQLTANKDIISQLETFHLAIAAQYMLLQKVKQTHTLTQTTLTYNFQAGPQQTSKSKVSIQCPQVCLFKCAEHANDTK